MGLRKFLADNHNSPIFSLTVHRDDIDLCPPYQRGSVWDVERRRNLIKSLVMGLPIGALFLNRRSTMDPERVVDGKQRIETIYMFIDDKLVVPREWFDENSGKHPIIVPGHVGDWIGWVDLTVVGRRFFEQIPIAMYRTKLPSEADEKELYDLINYGGVPH